MTIAYGASMDERSALALLSTFIAVVEVGSFTGAAGTLGQSPATVSRSIARLEDIRSAPG